MNCEKLVSSRKKISKGQMLINQFATFLSNKSVLYLFSVIDDSSVTFFGQYHLLRIICLYNRWKTSENRKNCNEFRGYLVKSNRCPNQISKKNEVFYGIKLTMRTKLMVAKKLEFLGKIFSNEQCIFLMLHLQGRISKRSIDDSYFFAY